MDIFFDANHDMTLKNRDIRFTDPIEDLVQRLTIHLQFLLGEWFLDTSEGIPYAQTIFESSASDLKGIYVLFRVQIKNIEGVEKIDELEIDLNRDSRKLTINLKVNGSTEVEVII